MKNTYLLFALGFAALLFGGCEEDNGSSPSPDPDGGASSKYIVTATPIASEGVADYILTADDLTTGTISTTANGIEQDGTYRYYVTSNNKFFSMLYGQGNAGAVTTYELNSSGELEVLSDFQAETVRAFAPVAEDLLTIKMTASADDPYLYWYRISTNSLTIVNEGQINCQEVANKENGELAYFSWITAKGDDLVYLPYFTIKGTTEGGWSTDYPDEANVAVYSYPEMQYVKTISDDRTSFIGRYFTSGLTFDEQGDGYAFSSAVPMNANWEVIETLPSAVTRIANATDDFDDYYFNLEEASGGYVIDSHIYAGDGKFIGIMQNKAEMTTAWGGGKAYAIIDVYNKTFDWVTGMPDPATITQITTGGNNLVSEDGGTVHVGVTTETGSFVYNIDVATSKATQGLAVEGGLITAINILNSASEEE
ncbi:protein of unknown function [Reichenbachiella agariperforans]|uniref:DUF4374 domain-containing protein n=1 Tax=Reichenbachiella agariperforans TaxID=156994 RepID=A0A1M6UNX7_REIAG|nr:DUF4374 domain-containing protein [Reichenbachiella agariperforans]SHK70860.1 protein of unknown function [Reichenbachiella agariperforans]